MYNPEAFPMHTILIIGGSESSRMLCADEYLATWKISRFDRIGVSDDLPSIGIGEIRAFTKKLSLTPQQGTHIAGIILHGDKLTAEAQQALLKTLEEPPEHAYMIIAVSNSAVLLPTIISRGICITLKESFLPQDPKEADDRSRVLHELMHASRGKRLALLGALGKSKDDLAAWADGAIETLEHDLTASRDAPDSRQTAARISLLHALIETRKYRENNVNLLLLLEHAFLSLP